MEICGVHFGTDGNLANTPHAVAGASSANTHTLTRRVFLAPFVLLMMMVSGPPMEQMFFSRAPPHTGTLETVKSCTGEGEWDETVVKETRSRAWISFMCDA